MPAIKVKTVYIEKLKALGVYDQWLANMKLQFEVRMIFFTAITDFNSFISATMLWTDTPEGSVFWKNVAYID